MKFLLVYFIKLYVYYFNSTLLHVAAKSNNIEIIKFLLNFDGILKNEKDLISIFNLIKYQNYYL